ncbi:MAG: TSUP family transporter [Candidatus Lokiarchaeota archaeon]|nr:TSUP family transporter [Candidatus Lokiarchaeota archaeon]
MQLDLFTTALTAIVIFLSAFVHGIAGFGAAQVAMGLLPLFRDPATGSIIFTFIAIVLNFRVWWSVREDFDWKDWLIPVSGLILGLPTGIFLFQGLDETALRIVIGITLVIGVILIIMMRMTDVGKSWMRESSLKLGWKTGILAGFFAGVLGGSVAIPGPPMILYGTYLLATEEWEGSHTKAVFTAFFGTLMTYRLASLSFVGAITVDLILEAIVVMPALFIGSAVGIFLYNRIDETKFKWIVLTGLALNALILILTAIPEF